jgi:hypothetical protein
MIIMMIFAMIVVFVVVSFMFFSSSVPASAFETRRYTAASLPRAGNGSVRELVIRQHQGGKLQTAVAAGMARPRRERFARQGFVSRQVLPPRAAVTRPITMVNGKDVYYFTHPLCRIRF